MPKDIEQAVEVYSVSTECLSPKATAQGIEIRTMEYVVLAKSCKEAIEIVEASCVGVDEIVRRVGRVTHITGLPARRYTINSTKD